MVIRVILHRRHTHVLCSKTPSETLVAVVSIQSVFIQLKQSIQSLWISPSGQVFRVKVFNTIRFKYLEFFSRPCQFHHHHDHHDHHHHHHHNDSNDTVNNNHSNISNEPDNDRNNDNNNIDNLTKKSSSSSSSSSSSTCYIIQSDSRNVSLHVSLLRSLPGGDRLREIRSR